MNSKLTAVIRGMLYPVTRDRAYVFIIHFWVEERRKCIFFIQYHSFIYIIYKTPITKTADSATT